MYMPTYKDFLEFAKTKDPTETFVYPDDTICACAQFAHSKKAYMDWKGRGLYGPEGAWNKMNTPPSSVWYAGRGCTWGALVDELEYFVGLEEAGFEAA